ncbi:DUF5986 family protein [Lacticaseibacillus paracasei subsp. paracasei]|uniref:DUF5986 family protein n=1 Tax=Lacticaseibacillus paracasei TaxID=1597 RepID=UPI001E51E435|nr:DUF5986 family protein [Lacticaseibacillus paracasei]MCD0431933.1 DUF5986 family protein [Lacticaseibacillus paracasei subsp. paracasei]
MDYNQEVVAAQISAMRFTDSDIAPDYQAISTVTNNGRHFSTWDRRFQILCDKLAKNPRYQQIIIPRGLWTLVAILDKDESKLYVMMTDQNLSARRHEVELKGFSTHYVYSLLFVNEGLEPVSEQLEMIPPLDDDKQEHRIKDLEKMLGDWVDQVSEVLIGSFEYGHGEIIGGSLNLFDDNYRLVDSVDLSEQILHPIGQGDVQSNPDIKPQPQEPIVKLRAKRRSQEDKEKKSNSDEK